MKRIKVLIGITLCAALFTGCVSAYDLTDEEQAIIAEYAAGVLYERSYAYMGKYIDDADEPETETETETAIIDVTTQAEETTDESGSGAVEIPVFEVSKQLGITPCTVTYTDFVVADSIPVDDTGYFEVTPSAGYTLLSLHFDLYNPSDEAMTLDTAGLKKVFRIVIDAEYVCNNYGNLLLNDLSNLHDFVVEAGETRDVQLVFEVEKEAVEEINIMQVRLYEDGTSLTINVAKQRAEEESTSEGETTVAAEGETTVVAESETTVVAESETTTAAEN